jgi:hypothetical protein
MIISQAPCRIKRDIFMRAAKGNDTLGDSVTWSTYFLSMAALVVNQTMNHPRCVCVPSIMPLLLKSTTMLLCIYYIVIINVVMNHGHGYTILLLRNDGKLNLS